MKAFLEARKQFVIIIGIALLILLMMNINSRLSEYFHLEKQHERLETEVASLERTQIVLGTRVAYATSDQAVEDWAREDAHMAQPDDVVVIQLTPAGQTPIPYALLTPTPVPAANWEVWWTLFFNE